MRKDYEEDDPALRSALPFCVVCDEPIVDSNSYNLSIFESDVFDMCMCQKCKEELISDLERHKINTVVMEWLDSKLDEVEIETPRRF